MGCVLGDTLGSVGTGKISCRATGVCDGRPAVSTADGRWEDLAQPTHLGSAGLPPAVLLVCKGVTGLGPGEDGTSPFALWLSPWCLQVSCEQLFPLMFFQCETIQSPKMPKS